MVLDRPGPIDSKPLALRDAAEPACSPTEVIVKVRVCGVCRTDLHIVEGELPPRRDSVIPGHEIVGTVHARGVKAGRFEIGQCVGAGWMHATCGHCGFCTRGRENLCEEAAFTGYSVDGGYAEYVAVPEDSAYRIPAAFGDEQAAPLLCAGVIGFRALRATGVQEGRHLGLYGFGGSAHIVIQVARFRGCRVSVLTRSEPNRRLARELGAEWVGGVEDRPLEKLDGAIVFAPNGDIVRSALTSLQRGGTLVLAGIHMSEIPPLDYRTHLYDEKVLQSVANATRDDAESLLRLAGQVPIRTSTCSFDLEQANEALLSLKAGRIRGAAVLRVGDA
jgi:propanol-preferring alcohol dehydrogenase